MFWIKNLLRETLVDAVFLFVLGTSAAQGAVILIEAEGFAELGGWVIDQQAMDQMGSPYLLAHGLGVPVATAATTVNIPEGGTYRVLVRTRNWIATWQASGAPGKFQIAVNGRRLDTPFGAEGAAWHWQSGGKVDLPAGPAKLTLHDLTGFDGRCDAIVLTNDDGFTPPNEGTLMDAFRRHVLKLPATPEDADEYDLVVVGGGLAGCCAAVSAARLGCKVALIHDRPVLGGNNSSETRVGLSGLIHQPPYPRLGDLVDEIGPIGHWNLHDAKAAPDLPRSKEVLAVVAQHPEKKQHNAGPATNYADEQKLRVVLAAPNLRLFLATRVIKAEKDGARITAVTGRDIVTGRDTRFRGRVFADCTGDGCIGYLSGADFRSGRESKSETGESLAPEQSDNLTMGVSVQWYSADAKEESSFPECPWALQFTETTCDVLTRGDWDWETGMNLDSVSDIEQIRDNALRAVYGNWSFLKNRSNKKAAYAKRRLSWVAFIGGKRESRRLLGDVILCQQDIEERRAYPDACVTTTWGMDLHYPNQENAKHFPGQAFRSIAKITPIKPYAIPYRCLYSRNIENLMMAGRDISVTHVALGSVRVMRTGGMMGEVLGMAAALCTRQNTTPRGVYRDHLKELQKLMKNGIGRPPASAGSDPDGWAH